MATFLELVRQTAGESGTVPDGYNLSTVVGQTGRKAKIVAMVARSWNQIQTDRPNWLWMRGLFTGTLTIGQPEYVGALPRFSHFLATRDQRENRFSLYDSDEGRSGEGTLRFIPFDQFYTVNMRGSGASATGKPTVFTIGTDGTMLVHPVPDKAYVVRGQYVKTLQMLETDAEVPEMPQRFHDLIVYEALIRLAAGDESFSSLPIWASERRRLMEQLTLDQLPPMRESEPML